jgi:hypothetical protein
MFSQFMLADHIGRTVINNGSEYYKGLLGA